VRLPGKEKQESQLEVRAGETTQWTVDFAQ
jgi:hypothetical protein